MLKFGMSHVLIKTQRMAVKFGRGSSLIGRIYRDRGAFGNFPILRHFSFAANPRADVGKLLNFRTKSNNV